MPTGFNHRPTAARLRTNAKNLRRQTTDAETKMWQLLRSRRLAKFKFRRQTPIEGFIADFVCFERKLIVEIDGSQHAESQSDRTRDAKLDHAVFRTLRYWNNDVLQRSEAVLEDIVSHLERGDH
jgi:very-short-patch-repair endonuclease